jgi:hypothetical protein
MPVFIQWKWQDNTQTFLMIMHFDVDQTANNLRQKEIVFQSSGISFPVQSFLPLDIFEKFREEYPDSDDYAKEGSKRRSVTTWAPTHVEIGLVSELLGYANIINGLKVWKRQALRNKLDIGGKLPEVAQELIDRFKAGKICREEVCEELDNSSESKETIEQLCNFAVHCGKKPFLFGHDFDYKKNRLEIVFCFELSQEYIDYLKELLKTS